MNIELPVTTRHRRDMTDNVESDVKREQTNNKHNFNHHLIIIMFYMASNHDYDYFHDYSTEKSNNINAI